MASSRGEDKTGGIVKLDMIDVLEKRKKEKQKGYFLLLFLLFKVELASNVKKKQKTTEILGSIRTINTTITRHHNLNQTNREKKKKIKTFLKI